MNETFNSTIQPIIVNSQPSLLYVISGLIFPIVFLSLYSYGLLKPAISYWSLKRNLRNISKIYGKNILVMCHKSSGFFGSMITMDDCMKIEAMIRKYSKNGKGFLLILNTFGGDLLASMRLAQLIKRNNIDVCIPKYAWSGGSLMAVASPNLIMSSQSTLSPFDVQLGSFLKIFAAKHWIKIAKIKGKKMQDDTVAMAELSKELLEEQKQFALTLINKSINKEKYLDYFLFGKKSHAFQITRDEIRQLGFNVNDKEPESDFHRIVEKTMDTVFGYKWK